MASSQTTTQIISGIGDIADRYDAFILDQWGVLHDGVTAAPGAITAVDVLSQAGKKIVILSNSGKPSEDSHTRMAGMGFRRDTYLDIVTSGDTVRQCLTERSDSFYQGLGQAFAIFAWDDHRGIVEGLGYDEVSSLQDADFLLCTGTDRLSLDAYREDLTKALDLGLPMICANPDRVSVQPDGSLRICPGALAELYETMGGTVRWHGKPNREIYAQCHRVADGWGAAIGVGDSLIHDVKGAHDSGLDALFISSGVHKDEIGPQAESDTLAPVFLQYEETPRFTASVFQW